MKGFAIIVLAIAVAEAILSSVPFTWGKGNDEFAPIFGNTRVADVSAVTSSW